MAAHIRSFDWASTPLGPLGSWPATLRTAVDLMLASPQPAYIGWGPAIISLYNDAYVPLLAGKRRPVFGEPFREVWGELLPKIELPLERALSGKAVAFEDSPFHVPGRTDQPEAWFSGSWIPLRDDEGKFAGFLAMFIETTGRVKAERHMRKSMADLERAQSALAANEQRLRLATDAGDIFAWEIDVATGRVHYSSSIAKVFGFDPAGSLDQFQLIDLVHPDDRHAVAAGMQAARDSGGNFVGEYRARSTGGWIWIHSVVVGHLGPDGSVERWIGMSQDITPQKAAEHRQATLLAELQHRVRNILAMIRSIARRTGETSRSVEDYAQHLEGRISALARTQTLLTRDPGVGVDLRDMLLEEFRSQAASEGQFHLSGPDIKLAPKAAEVLTLAIHELTTNSVKYGALSSPGSALTVRWRRTARDGRPSLSLEWREDAVPIPEGCRKQGFGTELISSRVPYELHGTGELEFRSDGLTAKIEFPLVEGESILQTSLPVTAELVA